MFHDLKQSLEAVRSLVDVVASQADRRDDVVSSIILVNHPLFLELRNKMNVPYRFVVETIAELNAWMSARGFNEDIFPDEDKLEWSRSGKSDIETIKIKKSIFDSDNNLKPFRVDEWSDDFVIHQTRKKSAAANSFAGDLDDDIPF